MAGRRRRSTQQSSNATVDFEIDGDINAMRENHFSERDSSAKISFADVESVIRKFDGAEMNVRKWITEFEQYASVFRWNELQKFIFCKRSLTGAAKLFVDCEAKPLNYNELRQALHKEFQAKITSAEVHAKLRERRKNNNESFREYLYCMLEIASQVEVEELSIISYVIDGINDTANNKSVLFGANTISELKEKLTVYEKIKKSEVSRPMPEKGNTVKHKVVNSGKKIQRYCFNCGSNEHEFHSCPQKAKGPKCFRCNKYGHKKPDCKEDIVVNRNLPSTSTSLHIVEKTKGNMCIDAKINNMTFESLIDTGSDICVLKECYLKLINRNYHSRNFPITIAGLGASVTTKGSCIVTIEINGDIYEDIEVHAVEDTFLKPDMIVGMNLLRQATVNISNGNINIQKNAPEKNDSETQNEEQLTCFLAMINDEAEEHENFPGLSNLKKEEINKVLSLIKNYSPNFPDESPVRMKIVTVDDEPVYRPPRRFPPSEQKIIEQIIKQWLDEGIIRESSSDYASQVVLVKKKDGSHRLCIDFRGVNKKIIKERYPLPLIEDQIDKLQAAKFFTSLDLENGFFHVTVEEESRKYTSFVVHCGQYEFIKVPFGLCNSPNVFQKYINFILRDLIRQGIVIVFIDDVVIPAETIEEAISRSQVVLEVAARNGLRMKWRKYQFLQKEIEYLGHRIHNGSVSPSLLKTKAVLNFPVPSTTKQLQSFLGLANYFRKFIPNFATRARPLSELLKKSMRFKIGEVELAAINDLKQALVHKPVLKIFTYGAPTELHTDASQEGYGAVLLQKDDEDGSLHPVYYSSRKTSDAEKKYSSYELEVLAIIEALKKFCVYLLGQQFKLVTDCKAFECTMKKKDLTTRVARWALLLEEFNYVIEHRAGSKMAHVDALSRNPTVMCIYKKSEFLKKLAEAQRRDESLLIIIEILREKPYKDYIMNNEVLCKNLNNNLLFVVPDGMKNQIVREVHERGHFHYKKMKEIIEKDFYIPDLQRRITKHITNCVRCILAERKTGKAEGLLQPIPKGERPLETFHIDHLGPMQTTRKHYKYIFSVIDGFSKFLWLFPTKTLSAEEAKQKLVIIAETFGHPERIIADKGGAFISKIFLEYCKDHDINLHFITVGVPRGNGQIERTHSVVISALTKLSLEDTERWYNYVKPVQQMINSTYQRAIKTTPFKLLTGCEMKTQKDLRIMEIIEEEYIKQFEDERQELREKAKKDIAQIQKENKRGFDKKRKEAQKYQLGELVAIERVQFGTGLKIRPKFLGPYRVIAIKGFDRYKVQKEGAHEGPKVTDTSADKMKPWTDLEIDEDSFSTDDEEHTSNVDGTAEVEVNET